jgi:ligand-binding sensor domain-containing protein/signal transduction histidine kinase/CheY-like chemotaxis protein/AraC-like DNA-binding protein
MKEYILFTFLFFTSLFVQSSVVNNVRFAHITNELPQNTVNCITQDNAGFIWMGTRNGLSRYDGYNIKSYFHNENDSLSLSNNFIITLHKDRSGILWILNEKGICRYDKQSDKFKRYELWKGIKVIRGKLIHETASGKLLVANHEEIYIYNPENDSFHLLLTKSLLATKSIFSITSLVEDSKGILWIGTNKGVRFYDLKNMRFVAALPHNEINAPLFKERIRSIFIDSNRRVWIGTVESGIFVVHPSKGIIKKFSTKNGLSNNYIGAITSDNYQNIWIGTERGVNIIDPDLLEVQCFEQGMSDVSNLSDNAIYSIFVDNADDVWIGTYFGGVNVFYKGYENFSIYSYGYSNKHLSGKAVRQIIANDTNSLWIATEDGGLNLLDRKTGQIYHFKNKNDKIGLSYHNVHSLLKDRNNNLWIGTFTGGLNCYNLNSGSMKYYSRSLNNLSSISVFSLIEDKEGIVWAGTQSGLMFFVPDENRFVPIDHPVLRNAFIYCMFENDKGEIMIGTRKFGLFKLNNKTKEIKQIKLFDRLENFITSIYQDSEKQLWIATNNDGVIRLNENDEMKILTVKDGLPSNAVKALIEDDNGNMWLSTEAGLSSYSLSTQAIVNYNKNDGLPINQFNFSSAFKANDGEMFFGTINGMISFYPNSLRRAREVFKVEMTGFKISGKEVIIGETDSPLEINISETESIVLSHNQAASFSFEFTGLNYRYASNTIYAIKLDGADAEWQVVNKQRQILFSNLPQGKYKLLIKASIDGVNWDETGIRTLEIIIKPPFWKSSWAYLFYMILLCIAGYLIIKTVKARIKLRMKFQTEHAERLQLEDLNRHKINFFTFITHDLKTPLTLILSPLQRLINTNKISSETKQKLEIILSNANRMNRLIDDMMTFSRIEMKQMKITVKRGDVLDFLKELSSIFEMVAVERDIEFIIDIPSNKNEIVWFSPSKLERIIYNLLSNAFKYTPNSGIITLSANISKINDQSFLNIIIEDSGRGIPKDLLDKIFENYYQVQRKDEKTGTGIGLALTKVLVNLHKGTIKAESEPGTGTKFIVQLNVSESAFDEDEKSVEFVKSNNIAENNKHFSDSVRLFSESMGHLKIAKNNKKKLLIVEDNPEMNDYITEIFMSSFLVVRAFDGEEGYKKLISENPDLVISDVMMPVMDGLELTEKIKSDLSFSHIPVVLLTAKSMEEDIKSGYSTGVDAYIVKPFSSENLELLVNNLLKTRQMNIDRFNHMEGISVQELVSNPRDEKFMSTLVDLILKNLANEEFGIAEITVTMGVSRSLLHIKLKKLADVSITEFIRQLKMKEARKLLLAGNNVSETSYAVGMSDPNYFTKCFKKQMGITPSDFVKTMRSN